MENDKINPTSEDWKVDALIFPNIFLKILKFTNDKTINFPIIEIETILL